MLDENFPLVRGRNAPVLRLIAAAVAISSSYIVRPALASIDQSTAVQPSSGNTVRVSGIPALRGLVLHADGNVPLLTEGWIAA